MKRPRLRKLAHQDFFSILADRISDRADPAVSIPSVDVSFWRLADIEVRPNDRFARRNRTFLKCGF